jgi:hypothetical protein
VDDLVHWPDSPGSDRGAAPVFTNPTLEDRAMAAKKKAKKAKKAKK